jgi:RNA polymerase sigma-70 factor (ECF subfamily)
LKVLLLKLDYKYREVLILYYFEWKSYDEIAQILETTKNTVWSWIKRAKDKLKEIVEKDPVLKQALEI